MNICMNSFIIDECPKFLHPESRDKTKVSIAQYKVEYNFLITLKFNDSIAFPNT